MWLLIPKKHVVLREIGRKWKSKWKEIRNCSLSWLKSQLTLLCGVQAEGERTLRQGNIQAFSFPLPILLSPIPNSGHVLRSHSSHTIPPLCSQLRDEEAVYHSIPFVTFISDDDNTHFQVARFTSANIAAVLLQMAKWRLRGLKRLSFGHLASHWSPKFQCKIKHHCLGLLLNLAYQYIPLKSIHENCA